MLARSANRKKNTLFSLQFLSVRLLSLLRGVKGLFIPCASSRPDQAVTWVLERSNVRNVENSRTAHKYKLCGKGGRLLSVVNGLCLSWLLKSAVQVELLEFELPRHANFYHPPLNYF